MTTTTTVQQKHLTPSMAFAQMNLSEGAKSDNELQKLWLQVELILQKHKGELTPELKKIINDLQAELLKAELEK